MVERARPGMAATLPLHVDPAPYVVFGRPQILEDDVAEVVSVLRDGWLGRGPRVAAFEREFAAFVGAPRAVAVGSGTAALHLAMIVSGLGPGDEVVVPALTFAATAAAAVHVTATPVFADVDPDTMCVTAETVEACLSPRTRMIVPVHF